MKKMNKTFLAGTAFLLRAACFVFWGRRRFVLAGAAAGFFFRCTWPVFSSVFILVLLGTANHRFANSSIIPQIRSAESGTTILCSAFFISFFR